jgi:type IX secretion system PorP/SprF family membrane protein
MKRIFTIIVLFFISTSIFAQQDAQVTHNMFNNLFVNPGYAGITKQICVNTILRQQWVGFKDPDGNKVNPETYILSLDSPIRFLHGGIGLSVYNDKLGFENNLGVKIDYSFHLNIGIGTLGIGIAAGFLNKTIDFSKFKPIDLNDQALMSQEKQKTFITDVSFGLFYNIPGKAYVGLSSTQLIQSDMKIPNLNSELVRHYYLVGGYHWVIPSSPSWELSPYLLVKSDLASTSFDFCGMVKYENRFWAGVNYRLQDAVSILIGANPFNAPGLNPALANLRIGYSYDITTSSIGKEKRSSGSHEIMLGYCFKIVTTPKVTKYINTRFL